MRAAGVQTRPSVRCRRVWWHLGSVPSCSRRWRYARCAFKPAMATTSRGAVQQDSCEIPDPCARVPRWKAASPSCTALVFFPAGSTGSLPGKLIKIATRLWDRQFPRTHKRENSSSFSHFSHKKEKCKARVQAFEFEISILLTFLFASLLQLMIY